ncbi:MAG: twin-arginine translocation signal domain-containing protein, partial [Candidatus Omnitrophica bacterium]|nr:twin-arginine translocation signal domain-containing protein [Candidatus Omnitrophota bacterium]
MIKSRFFKLIALVLCFSLVFEQSGFAQVVGQLDISSHLLSLRNSLTQDKFRPLHLRYLDYDSQKNNFKLLLDKGDLKDIKAGLVQDSTRKLMEYFFVGLALPNDSFWVNLRPDSPDNVIDPFLAQTDVGRILLEADLQLKKDTARMTSPETKEGKEYWNKLYKKAEELLGYDNVTIPTLTRPWIVPGEIIIRETPTNAYIYKANLKVMLEQDYLKDSAVYKFDDPRLKVLNEYASQLIRELIIPKLTKEINTAKRYASLRQVYCSLILAQWFKQRFRAQDNQYSRLLDTRDLNGLTSKEPWSKATYFNDYQKSFKNGEYNLKEPVHTPLGQSIRTYMSGGITIATAVPVYDTNATGKIQIGEFTLVRGNPNKELIPQANNTYIITAEYSEGKTVASVSKFEEPTTTSVPVYQKTQDKISISAPLEDKTPQGQEKITSSSPVNNLKNIKTFDALYRFIGEVGAVEGKRPAYYIRTINEVLEGKNSLDSITDGMGTPLEGLRGKVAELVKSQAIPAQDKEVSATRALFIKSMYPKHDKNLVWQWSRSFERAPLLPMTKIGVELLRKEMSIEEVDRVNLTDPKDCPPGTIIQFGGIHPHAFYVLRVNGDGTVNVWAPQRRLNGYALVGPAVDISGAKIEKGKIYPGPVGVIVSGESIAMPYFVYYSEDWKEQGKWEAKNIPMPPEKAGETSWFDVLQGKILKMKPKSAQNVASSSVGNEQKSVEGYKKTGITRRNFLKTVLMVGAAFAVGGAIEREVETGAGMQNVSKEKGQKKKLVVLISAADPIVRFTGLIGFPIYGTPYFRSKGYDEVQIIDKAKESDLKKALADPSVNAVIVQGHGSWNAWIATDKVVTEETLNQWAAAGEITKKDLFIRYTCGRRTETYDPATFQQLPYEGRDQIQDILEIPSYANIEEIERILQKANIKIKNRKPEPATFRHLFSVEISKNSNLSNEIVRSLENAGWGNAASTLRMDRGELHLGSQLGASVVKDPATQVRGFDTITTLHHFALAPSAFTMGELQHPSLFLRFLNIPFPLIFGAIVLMFKPDKGRQNTDIQHVQPQQSLENNNIKKWGFKQGLISSLHYVISGFLPAVLGYGLSDATMSSLWGMLFPSTFIISGGFNIQSVKDFLVAETLMLLSTVTIAKWGDFDMPTFSIGIMATLPLLIAWGTNIVKSYLQRKISNSKSVSQQVGVQSIIAEEISASSPAREIKTASSPLSSFKKAILPLVFFVLLFPSLSLGQARHNMSSMLD